jgi:hypothetical protein
MQSLEAVDCRGIRSDEFQDAAPIRAAHQSRLRQAGPYTQFLVGLQVNQDLRR